MALIAVGDMFGISGRRSELEAALASAERDAAGERGCLRYPFARALADPDHYGPGQRVARRGGAGTRRSRG